MLQRRFAPEVDNFPGLGGQLQRNTHLNPGLKLSIPSGDVGTARIDVAEFLVRLQFALKGQYNRSPGLSRRRNPG